jgi:CBS domain-containing protein
MDCPDCGFSNIEGVDECDQCQQPLSPLTLPEPASELERSILTDRIDALNPREPLVVEPGAPVSLVLQLLVAHAVGCAVVVEDGEPVGIFSERDALLRLNVDAAEHGDRPISDFMTPNPQTLDIENKIAFALQRMDAGGYRHVPIMTDGVVSGIISVRDVLNYLSEKLVAQQS